MGAGNERNVTPLDLQRENTGGHPKGLIVVCDPL